MSLADKNQQFATDTDIVHQITHGDADTVVQTEKGPVRSLAKVAADNDVVIRETGLLGEINDVSQQAANSATAALAERLASEAARDAAQLSAGVKKNTAEGISATSPGQYFSVPAGSDAEALILYKNEAGVAVEVTRYPSAAAVTKIGSIIKETTLAKKLLSVLDVDGYEQVTFFEDGSVRTTSMWFKPDGDAMLVRDEEGLVAFNSRKAGTTVADHPAFNKDVAGLGDSITETGKADEGNFGLGVRSNWPDYAYPMLKMASLRNYARSGASFREYAGQLQWQKMSTQVAAALAYNVKPSIVVVACGTNDGTANLGDYATAMSKANLSDLDMSKTAEAMRWCFWKLAEGFPNAKIFAVLPLQRADFESEDRQPLLDLIRKMAERYGIVVIDAHHQSGIVKDFEKVNQPGRDLLDGLHPGPTGQLKLALLIVAIVKMFFNY